MPPVPCCTPHHSIERRVFLAAGVCCGQLFWSVIGVYLPVRARVIIKDYITGPRWVSDGWPSTIFNWENLQRDWKRDWEREIAIWDVSDVLTAVKSCWNLSVWAAEWRLCGNIYRVSHHWTADFSPGRSWLDSNKTQFVVGWLWRRNLGYHALILVIWIISSSVGKLTEWFSIFVILIVRSTLQSALVPPFLERGLMVLPCPPRRQMTQAGCVKVWSCQESWVLLGGW